TRPSASLLGSWWRSSATTLRSIGRCARTCAPSFGCLSNGSCANTDTRPTSRRRLLKQYWSRPRSCLPRGRPDQLIGLALLVRRSFHLTTVDGLNGPSPARWVENDLNQN